MKNQPIDDEKMGNKPEIDSLALRIIDLKKRKKKIELDELQIIEETTQYVDKKYPKHMTKGKGVKTLYGHEYQLKVTPNYGVTYPRERDETNPLYNIVKKFPNLVRDGYCKLEPKESGSQVEKLLDSDEEHTKWLQEAIQEIKTFRVKKPIKPKIEVK